MAELTDPLAGATSTRRRTLLAAGVTLLVLAVAVVAALASPTTGGAPVIAVEQVSSAIGAVASRAHGLWWVYAFALGVAAAFNPCGFALVPAYLGLYLSDGGSRAGLGSRLARSVTVAAVVGASFTVLFGVMGAVFSLVSALLVRLLPWIGLAVGVLLVLAGGWVMSGGHLASSLPPRLAARIGSHAGSSGVRGYTAFGLAYGAASLGCTLPLFLALLGTAAASGPLSALLAFVLYGAGMATVLAVLTIVAGTVSFGVLDRVRGFVRVIGPLSAGLLLLSGAYVIYYWLTTGRPLLA